MESRTKGTLISMQRKRIQSQQGDMRMSRHESFNSSWKYIHTIQSKDEDFDETVAMSFEEIRALGKA